MKTKQQLEIENAVMTSNKEERKISDLKYAPMWVKVVLVWGGGIIGLAVINAFMNLILVKK